MDKIKIIAVAGPTASGKTKTAIDIANRFNGEIVSCDSMQIYKGMDIGTAKPTAEERRQAVHHLIDFVELDKSFSVVEYVKLANSTIDDIVSRGKIPILAGGTGLYMSSLLDNIMFEQTKSDPELKVSLNDMLTEKGIDFMFDMLKEIDIDYANTLHKNNTGRVLRAIEVYKLTGITMTEHIKNSRVTPSRFNCCKIGLSYQDRQKLYDRINQRVDIMIQQGLIEETVDFYNQSSQTAKHAIGYKELKPYLDGEIDLDEAIDKLKQETRRYAKRQLTWFRKDLFINWYFHDNFINYEQMKKNIFKTIEINFEM